MSDPIAVPVGSLQPLIDKWRRIADQDAADGSAVGIVGEYAHRNCADELESALSAALATPPQPKIAIEKHTAQCLEIALLLGGAGFPEDMPIQDAVRELIHRAALAPPVGPSIPQHDFTGRGRNRAAREPLAADHGRRVVVPR
jgi:hypothetical protein